MSNYKSPAKKLRNLKRVFTFLMNKPRPKVLLLENLQIHSQVNISILPKPTFKPSFTSVCVQTEFTGSQLYPPASPETSITLPDVHLLDRFCPDDDYGTPAYHEREAKRQENVRKTLEMIEKALSF